MRHRHGARIVFDMSAHSNKCLRCHVSGRVQGVFFRADTQTKAQELGLSGFARNMNDGRVEVYACGPPVHLDALKEWLRRGPTGASVTAVDCESAAGEHLNGFEVR
jgi:acylphosphatase